MKRLSLFLCFAFMASVALAQTATITQTGTNNGSSILQSMTGNNATTDQNGVHNLIKVEQKTGSGNVALVNQNGNENGAGSVPVNKGYVKQDGANNKAYINEGVRDGAVTSFADAYIDQLGEGNSASITSEGNYFNSIYHGITQIHNLQGLGNRADVFQKNYNSDMSIFQKGADNAVTGWQDGSNNQYAVKQDGLSNRASIIQLGANNLGGSWSNGTFDYTPAWNLLLQTGDQNTADAKQLGSSVFKMTQEGNLNVAKIEEQGNNIVTTFQQGNKNIIGGMIICNPSDVAVFADGSSMYATQLGDNNKLYVSTVGSLTVLQNSVLFGSGAEGNTIKYTQTHTGIVDFTQVGDKNLIWLKNTSTNHPMQVDVDQDGVGNTVGSFEADVCVGCAVFAGTSLDVDQKGNGNSLNLNSTFDGAVVTVSQNGNMNWASVVQVP